MKFWKYHGLGNSYLVVAEPITAAQAGTLCDVNYGIGSDGVLVDQPGPPQGVRIFNPDGSEAEKSGNGLRIFARWLFDQGRVDASAPFDVHTAGGRVTCRVLDAGAQIEVQMGRVQVSPPVVLVGLPGMARLAYPADIGNPHCVLLRDVISADEARELGPHIERHAHFPNRTNVQFAHVIDAHTVEIEIWERGAGYTLSSGSSSCAVAAVCASLGQVQSPVTVRTRGGELQVMLSSRLEATLSGPVEFIAAGATSNSM